MPSLLLVLCACLLLASSLARARPQVDAVSPGQDDAGATQQARVPDRTTPTISAILSEPANDAGWHRAPVVVSFACADDRTGVRTCSGPIMVNIDGEHRLNGRALDRAGNAATTDTVVKLDRFAPEVAIRPDFDTHDITATITDALSGVSTRQVSPTAAEAAALTKGTSRRAYVARDIAGNDMRAVVDARARAGSLHVEVVSLTYEGGDLRRVEANSLEFRWVMTRAGTVERLEQRASTGGGSSLRAVEATYDGKRDHTSLRWFQTRDVDMADGISRSAHGDRLETRPGLVLLGLETRRGRLVPIPQREP